MGHVLVIDGVDPTTSEIFPDSLFTMQSNGEWIPLSMTLGIYPKRVYSIKTFSGKNGVAVQAFDQHRDRRGPTWDVFIRKDGAWNSRQQSVPGAPSEIWDLRPFAGGDGIELQEFGDSDADGRSYERSWFIQSEENSWLPLDSEIRKTIGSGATVDRVHGSDLNTGIWIDATTSNQERSSRKYWIIRTHAGHWTDAVGHLHLAKSYRPSGALRHKAGGVDLLQVWNEEGENSWFSSSEDEWVPANRCVQG
jgi:hypothetical protein